MPETAVPKAIGVDDFALRRGKTYGTMIVDLLTHRPIALLKDRTAQTLTRWLETHPGVEFIRRDRSSEYMRGADEGGTFAQQILDRWHLLKNVCEVGKPHCQPGACHAQAATKRLWCDYSCSSSRENGVAVRLQPRRLARLRRQKWYEEVVELYRRGPRVLPPLPETFT